MIINISGPAGSFKSTTCKAIKDEFRAHLFEERFRANPYWQDLYKGKNVFNFQISSMTNYVEDLTGLDGYTKELNPSGDIAVLDCCFYVLPYLVSQHRAGLITNIDFTEYLRRWRVFRHLFRYQLSQMKNFILTSTPKKLLKNIKSRGREEEKGVDINFVRNLNNLFTSNENLDSYLIKKDVDIVDVSSLKKGEIPKEIRSYIESNL